MTENEQVLTEQLTHDISILTQIKDAVLNRDNRSIYKLLSDYEGQFSYDVSSHLAQFLDQRVIEDLQNQFPFIKTYHLQRERLPIMSSLLYDDGSGWRKVDFNADNTRPWVISFTLGEWYKARPFLFIDTWSMAAMIPEELISQWNSGEEGTKRSKIQQESIEKEKQEQDLETVKADLQQLDQQRAEIKEKFEQENRRIFKKYDIIDELEQQLNDTEKAILASEQKITELNAHSADTAIEEETVLDQVETSLLHWEIYTIKKQFGSVDTMKNEINQFLSDYFHETVVK